jgi:hypothetical protein
VGPARAAMMARVISQGWKDGNPTFTVELCSGEDEPYFEGKEISGEFQLTRDLEGNIFVTAMIREYVEPQAVSA